MDIKNCIETGLYTKELEEQMKGTTIYPLIQELHLTYGLKVSSRYPISWYEYDNNYQYRYIEVKEDLHKDERRDIKDCFMMSCRGIPVALVYWDIPNNKYAFHYKTSIKDRGKNSWDRKTISSVKISQIIKTIAKKEINFANVGDFTIDGKSTKGNFRVDGKLISDMKTDYERHLKTLSGGYEAHQPTLALVESLYGDKKPISHEHDTYFKDFVDKSKKLCETLKSAKEIVDSEMKNGFYAFGINKNTNSVIVGNFKVDTNHVSRYKEYEDYCLKDTDVIKSIEDFKLHEDIKPILTMIKVTLEDQDKYVNREYWLDNNYIEWQEDLGVLYRTNTYSEGSYNNPFSIHWLLITKGDECDIETQTQVSGEKM